MNVTVSGNVGLDPGCRDRGSVDNPKFIVARNKKYIQQTRRRQERVGEAGGGTGECCGPVGAAAGEELAIGEKVHEVRTIKYGGKCSLVSQSTE